MLHAIYSFLQNTENESLGRGNLLKTLTSQSNTSASNLPAYDIWSRDSKSLPPISPSQLSRDDSLTEFNASHYNSSIFPSLFQRLNTKQIQRAKMNTDLNEVSRIDALRVTGYSFRGSNYFIFIVVSHHIRGKLLNKRICKFFPLKVDPILKELHYPGQQTNKVIKVVFSHKSCFQS